MHVVDVSNINSFKINYNKFEKNRSPLNATSLTCGSTAVKAIQGKEPNPNPTHCGKVDVTPTGVSVVCWKHKSLL